MEEIKLASVKFKSAGKIYYFSTNLKLKKDDRVVVETARGLELGEISQELKDIPLIFYLKHFSMCIS